MGAKSRPSAAQQPEEPQQQPQGSQEPQPQQLQPDNNEGDDGEAMSVAAEEVPPPEETISQLRRQLALRDQELEALRQELQRYKVALRQARASGHLTATTATGQQQQDKRDDDNCEAEEKPTDELDDIIHDVSEIDLELPLVASAAVAFEPAPTDIELLRPPTAPTAETEEDDEKSARDIINIKEDDSDGDNEGKEEEEEEGDAEAEAQAEAEEDGLLLTSLTDAAISNLSQLAALQERCESQQQQHSTSKSPQQQQQQQQQQEKTLSNHRHHHPSPSDPNHRHHLAELKTPSPAPSPPNGLPRHDDIVSDDNESGNPFSLANQAAIAINAAAANANHHHHHQQQRRHQSMSNASTITPNLSQTQSLASVVAAAAVAAAAANDHHQHHLHHHHHQHPNHQRASCSPQQPPSQPQQTRLISSAVASPDFYHPLHHHQSVSSSLQFSPSTSVITTPSPSSLMQQQQQRRSISNASSNLVMSPIASPNYLRRQFLPNDGRLPLLSPSPTSLTTGSTSAASAASTSLAHLLQQHHHHHHHNTNSHHQQRSASALGVVGALSTAVAAAAAAAAAAASSPSAGTSASTPGGGGTSSSAVSPLMSNKNSSQARLNNMQIRHKFGYLGSGRAQFNSPHGFCLGLNQEIVVADTNNHRICIFDKSGTYITQFGSPGKEEGQLWNPRKVAILHRPILAQQQLSNNNSSSSSLDQANQLHLATHHQHHHNLYLSTGQSQPQHQHHHQHHLQHHQLLQNTNLHQSSNNNQHASNTNQQQHQQATASEPLYVVCDRGAERSRMQLFTKDGAFIKKIGIHYIDIVAGLAITQNGLIIVVDSVSPTVYIINGETGILNGWFDCSGHMKEPSDIAVKSDVPRNEYFICDFKGHCVVVFSEQGEYLRKIGHDGLTSYPNGIDISDDGDILVGDSHGNRFHVVVFDRNGNFVSQFECPHVKVSRCCGLKITREGYIVTLAKNNHHVLVLDTIHI